MNEADVGKCERDTKDETEFNRYLAFVSHFRSVWRSIEMRCAFCRLGEINVNLGTSISLQPKELTGENWTRELTKQVFLARHIISMDDLDAMNSGLADGVIRLQGTSIYHAGLNQKCVMPKARFSFGFYGQGYSRSEAFPGGYLSSTQGEAFWRILEELGLSEPDIEACLASWEEPYTGLSEFTRAFLKCPERVPVIGSRTTFVDVSALLPWVLDDVSADGEHLSVRVKSIVPVSIADLGVTLKLVTTENEEVRTRRKILAKDFDREEDMEVVSLDIEGRFESGTIVFNSAIWRIHETSFDFQEESTRRKVHEFFDGKLEILGKALFWPEQPNRKEQDKARRLLEPGVLWLLHLCGLATVPYSEAASNSEIDVIAFAEDEAIALAVEVTSGDAEDKIVKLEGRANSLRSHVKESIHIVPVLAVSHAARGTPLSSALIEQARDAGIAVLGPDEMDHMLEMAERGTNPKEVIEYVVSQIPTEEGDASL